MNLDFFHFIECLISSTIETLIIFIFLYALTKLKCSITPFTVIKTSVFIVALAIISFTDSNNLPIRALGLILDVILIWSIFGKKIIECIYLTIISYLCIIIIQFTIILLFRFTATMQDDFVIQLFANLLTLFLAVIFTRFIPIHHVYDFVIKKDIAFRFFLGNTFVITFMAVYLMTAHLPHFLVNFTIVIVVLALMVFVNVELLRSRVIVDKQRSIIDTYDKYLPIVDELIEQVRSRQHSYDNNILSLSALSQTCTDYESLKTELSKNLDFMSRSDLPGFLLKFNLKLLSGLLFQKYSVAQKSCIHIDFNIKNYNIQSKAPEYIIVEAVGILIDNAIEASDNDDTIYVTIDCTNNHFYFNIMNVGPVYTSDLHKKIFKRGYSTKAKSEKERGLGLPQLLDIVKAYKGNLDIGNRTRDDKQYIFFSIDI